MTPHRTVFAMAALIAAGCASLQTTTPMSQPYFQIDPKDGKTFQAMTKKQEQAVARCVETNSCDHAYYTRALLGLYESRDVAEQYFRKVIAANPKSHLAASSKTWMQLLQERAAPREATWGEAVLTAPALADANLSLAQTADRLVRELLERELMIQQLRGAKDADLQTTESLSRELSERDRALDALTGRKGDPASGQEATTLVQLKKQLADRDKKIAELSSKLEALKRIDQEMREKVRPIRPPAPIAPPGPPAPDTPPPQ